MMAAVLPVPVWAWPATSWPASASGRASAWIGVQCSKPASCTPRNRGSGRFSPAKGLSVRWCSLIKRAASIYECQGERSRAALSLSRGSFRGRAGRLAFGGFFSPNYGLSTFHTVRGQPFRPNPIEPDGGIRPMSQGIVNISDASFEAEVLKAEGQVLVDYWAEWCGPCKIIAPVLAEIAEEYKGKLKVAKLNIDENPQTPPKYGIRGIPTLMLFKDGNVEATKVGAVSKSQLAAFIDGNL